MKTSTLSDILRNAHALAIEYEQRPSEERLALIEDIIIDALRMIRPPSGNISTELKLLPPERFGE